MQKRQNTTSSTESSKMCRQSVPQISRRLSHLRARDGSIVMGVARRYFMII